MVASTHTIPTSLQRRQRSARRPSAAKRLEEAARGQQLRQANLHQRIFRVDERLLSLQNGNEVDRSSAQLRFGEFEAFRELATTCD